MKSIIGVTSVVAAVALQPKAANQKQPATAHKLAVKAQRAGVEASTEAQSELQFERDLATWERTNDDDHVLWGEIGMGDEKLDFDFDDDDDDFSDRKLLMNKGQLSGNGIAKPFKDGFTPVPQLIPQGPEANQAGKERWFRFFDNPDIVQMMQHNDPDELCSELLEGESRQHLLKMHALARIYMSLYVSGRDPGYGSFHAPYFEGMYWQFKVLESLAGDYSDKSGDPFTAHKAKSDCLEDVQRQTCHGHSWLGGGCLRVMRGLVHQHDFGSYHNDRYTILKRMKFQLTHVDRTTYHTDTIVGSDNLHKLRIDIRAFLFQVIAVNGLVQVDESEQHGCSTDKNLGKVLDSHYIRNKYAQVAPYIAPGRLEAQPCCISRCAFLKMVEAVGIFGHSKDHVWGPSTHMDEIDETFKSVKLQTYLVPKVNTGSRRNLMALKSANHTDWNPSEPQKVDKYNLDQHHAGAMAGSKTGTEATTLADYVPDRSPAPKGFMRATVPEFLMMQLDSCMAGHTNCEQMD